MTSGGDITWSDTLTDETLTEGDDGAPEVAPTGPSSGLVAGRYRVGPLVGRGGTGQVHQAHDLLTDEVRAIKFVPGWSARALRQLRKELTALRLLDLPGVVRMHGEGIDTGVGQVEQAYLVMDLLPGGAFDGRRGPWPAWSLDAQRLLESLARVHFAGVLHLDLKPGNVLFDAAGRPVLTDFGLARGRAVQRVAQGRREGTPRYMAPEQWAGEEVSPATDLYALGGMFWEMLAGRDLPRAREDRQLAADVGPEGVRRVVSAMLAERPEDRPQSAVEVLDALFDSDAVLGPAELPLPASATPSALRPLFDEERPSFRGLADDAAVVLHQATGGERGAVRAELDRWVRAGLAWWNGSRLRIERPAIERLQWAADPHSADLATRARHDTGEAVSRALALAATWRREGDVGRAVGLLEAIVPLASAVGRGGEAAEQLVVASLDRRGDLRRALHHALREGADDANRVGRAMLARMDGDYRRTWMLLAAEPPAGREPTLARRASWLRAFALGNLDRQALTEWLGDAPGSLPPSVWHNARGRLAYLDGDYGAAVDHYRQAATDPDLTTRVGAWTSGVSAALEAGALDEAQQLLDDASAALAGRRAPTLALRVHWLRRLAAYRAERAQDPEPGWVTAASVVSPRLAAQLGLVEAAVAWRAGQMASCRALAEAAALGFAGSGQRAGAALCRALAGAAGAPPPPPSELVALRPPELALQALALCGAEHVPDDAWGELVAAARAARPGLWGMRLDVLSLDEAVAARVTR